jgi:hypothetical protein
MEFISGCRRQFFTMRKKWRSAASDISYCEITIPDAEKPEQASDPRGSGRV